MEKSGQPTKEIFLHMKPVKDFFEFKTRSINHNTRVLYLIYHICWGSNLVKHIIRNLKSTKQLRMWSLLNYIPYAISCLVPYLLSCFTYLVLYVLSYPTSLVTYVLSCVTCLVPSVLCYLTYIISYIFYC